MGSKEKSSPKYLIEATFVIEGVVERHDVIGAIFGQTEGLFPKEFELRELQKSGKIGRIDITLKSEKDRTDGTIAAPSSLDRAETAIIAAAMESVDRVGPCAAKVSVVKISDVRVDKREQIMKRAKELMRGWVVTESQDIEKLLSEVSRADKKIHPVHYGRERLTATPDISKLKEIIVVEGRADVINLLKAGRTGVIALEGVKIPRTIINLVKRKEITAFLDGDRGGDLILKELLQVAKPAYVARAPWGKEVEELEPEEIEAALAARVPISEVEKPSEAARRAPAKRAPARRPPTKRAPARRAPAKRAPVAPPVDLGPVGGIASELEGTLEAVLLGSGWDELGRVPVGDLVEELRKREGVGTVVFDGIVTGRLVDAAAERGVGILVGERLGDGVRVPRKLTVRLFKDL
ncbi:MAG: DNA primase DnaG [Candidatus Bathyarchaeota archaeon]|nr:DNA primase DnaG [Candidatus Bathyarchaeota archaeon]